MRILLNLLLEKVLRMIQHQICFLFLAAGASTRMRGSDKLLQKIGGVPLILRILNEALKLNFPVFVTIPSNDTKRKLIVSKTNAVIIEVPDADLGMGRSIAQGTSEITKNLNILNLAICPADLPNLSEYSFRNLINYFLKSPELICRPTQIRNLKFGHPVIFPKKYFEELKLSEGDLGARKIVNENKKFLNPYETEDESYFLDLDSPEDFTEWLSRFS